MGISIDETVLIDLRNSFGTAGDAYMNSYAKLSNLIAEITSKNITGDAADELKAKYDEKAETFEAIKKVIEDTQTYLNERTKQFIDETDSLMKNMK